MAFGNIIGTLALSYIANCIPDVRSFWSSFTGIDDRINKCFKAAKDKFFKDKDFLPVRYSSFASLGRYLVCLSQRDSEVEAFMAVLEEEFRGDELCSNLLLEKKIEKLSVSLADYMGKTRRMNKDFKEVSSNLRSVNRNLKDRYHIERQYISKLLLWICDDKKASDYLDRVAVVTGDAGCGKTVLLADLVDTLEKEGIPVVGLKSDYLFDSSETDIDKAVNIGGKTLLGALAESASSSLTVLVIDQVDALSLSLTTRRKPLAEVQRVIQTAAENPNIRVVFSCREYDFQNDRTFERYETSFRCTVGRLTREQITNALTELEISTTGLSEEDYQFLEIPLNLSLFCRFQGDTGFGIRKRKSYHALYAKFWRYVLYEKAVDTGIQTDRLISYLTELSERMVSQQVLSFGSESMGTIWAKEQDFLLSQGFLNHNADKTKIQFFHQTLFDYTVARLFIENNRSIDTAFVGIHQGLFVRGRLKRVVEYLRDVSEDDYIRAIRSILGVGGSSKAYRFHLKYLAVSLMGAYEHLIPQEEEFISKHVMADSYLARAFVRSIKGIEPAALLVKSIKEMGGYVNCPVFYAEKVFVLLPSIFLKNRSFFNDIVIDIEGSHLSGERLEAFERVFNHFPFGSEEDVLTLIPIIEKHDPDPSKFPFELFYKNAIQFCPKIVSKRIIDHVSSVLEKWKSAGKLISDLDFGYEIEDLIESLSNCYPQESLTLHLSIIDLLLQSSLDGVEGELKSSSLFWFYNRQNSPYRFSDKVLDGLLSLVEKGVDESWEGVNDCLRRLSQTDIGIHHVIAIVGWLRAPAKYTEVITEYLLKNITKQEHSSLLKYYQIELFRAVFMSLNKSIQKLLIETVLQVSPDWEKEVFKGRRSTDYADTVIGKTRAQFLNTIPKEYLRGNYPLAWKELQEIQRKGFNLENEAPNRMQVMTGWSTLPDLQFDKMKPSDYVKLAEKYSSDSSLDFSTPTRTGNAWAMSERAKDHPHEFFKIYKELLINGKSDLFYVSCALESLLEGGIDEAEMEEIYCLLISALGTDINKAHAEVVMDVCRSLNFFIKRKQTAPAVLMEFVSLVAEKADDTKDDNEKSIDYNTGINRVRGCAVEHLVQCVYMESYRESIFAIMERIAGNASVATRCAALFPMAMLAEYDKERTMKLFLMLTSDYNVHLLRLPAHNLNPLNFLVRYDFESLIPYFEHCVIMHETHKSNIIWLWLATMLDKPKAKDLLFEMGDASVEGRSMLVRCTADYYRIDKQSIVEESLLRYLNYEEEELGWSYDHQLDCLNKWPQERVDSYLVCFFNASVVKYCKYKVYNYLKTKADSDANKALAWLIMLYPQKTDASLEQERILDVLLYAYNRILVFDKTDSDLEKAMDLLDSFLKGGNEYLINKAIGDPRYE